MKRFIQDGKCLLGVVLPENAGKEALFARDELVYAIRACCGDSPSIFMDGVSYLKIVYILAKRKRQ